MTHPVEKLRRVWTPGREVEEVVARLGPQTQLDSMVRDLLHRTIQQYGPVMLDFGSDTDPVVNTGTLRIEIIHGPGQDELPALRRRQASVWIEP